MQPMEPPPKHLDLQRDKGLAVTWADGAASFFPLAYLRRMSPSAEARELREQMEKNPLAVLPAGSESGPLRATDAELVGNYALRIIFSDGHKTGLYSWAYLREIDPDAPQPGEAPPGASGPDDSDSDA